VSNYSGADEVYVTSFPTAGARVKISNAGGHSPAWAPDGKTLYHVQGMKMTAAALETDAAIRVTERKVLFDDEYVQYRWSRQYDITPDGKRFIMIKNPPPGNVEVITNWFAELEKLDD
jgi:Tol biopolymer transport system component